jgi:3-deoxy-7-phosphoheptulonate synthase
MIFETDDLRIAGLRPLIPPAILMEELPIGEKSSATVAKGREQIQAILRGDDDRLLVVVGPCSVHDPVAALDYAHRLREAADRSARDLLIVMRVYFEKPRTIIGWKGLINDPHLDETFAINEGLHKARRFLLDVAELELPAGTEFLDPISPQFIADLVSWGAIGARTSESQVHRELASGLSMPVGFKNGTDGSIQVAIDAIRSASYSHHFLSVTKQGLAAIVETRGNPDCHLILRGGASGTNYEPAAIAQVATALAHAKLPARVVVDCSHANSNKSPAKQGDVGRVVAAQIAAGDESIVGVMLESFIEEGRQDVRPGTPLVYGQSITDACMSWERTTQLLEDLATATRGRRGRSSK